MLILKVFILQLFWFLVVVYGKTISPIWQIAAALGLIGLDYLIYRPKQSYGRFFLLILFFTVAGFLNDSSLIWFKIIPHDSYQYGSLALWIVFPAYYEKIFVKFKNWRLLLIALIGGIGGVITYWSAANLGALMINPGMKMYFASSQFIFWAAFFPISLNIYHNKKFWDTFLEKSIFFSFDRTGFLRHKKSFTEDLEKKDEKGKTALVTGATSGIGASAAAFLSRVGAKVYFTGRNEEKGKDFENKNKNTIFVSLDMADWKAVYEFAKTSDELDYIVFNAGSMPEKISVNESGVEFQCASQLLGHYYFLVWLKEFKKLKKGARVVWVSSGGMYLKKLDLKTLFKNPNYDKVDTYANVKRAQVTLVEELAKMSEWSDFFINSMHPGWVATRGLEEALPLFYRLMKNRLRTAEEGADTILWCLLSEKCLESGGFFFDRKKVSPYISQKYSPTSSERKELLNSIKVPLDLW